MKEVTDTVLKEALIKVAGFIPSAMRGADIDIWFSLTADTDLHVQNDADGLSAILYPVEDGKTSVQEGFTVVKYTEFFFRPQV